MFRCFLFALMVLVTMPNVMADSGQGESWYFGFNFSANEHLSPKVEEFGKGVLYPNGFRLQALWSLSDSLALGVSGAGTFAPVYSKRLLGVTLRNGFSGRQYSTWFGSVEAGLTDITNTGNGNIPGVGVKKESASGPHLGLSFGRNFGIADGSGIDLNLQYFYSHVSGLNYHSLGFAFGILW